MERLMKLAYAELYHNLIFRPKDDKVNRITSDCKKLNSWKELTAGLKERVK